VKPGVRRKAACSFISAALGPLKRAIACIRRHAAGKTVLLVTHDMEDAAGLNAKIVGLE